MYNTANILQFKEGNDNDGTEIEGFSIEIAVNGFVLIIRSDDGDVREIHTDIEDVFDAIKGYL